MNELVPAVILIGASLGVASVLGMIAWLTLKVSQRWHRHERRY